MPKWGRALGHLPGITSPASTGPPQRIHSPRGPSCRTPADPSSSIPPGLTALGHADPLRPAETPHLLAYLATVTDPRARAGRRHPLAAILMLAAVAVLAGARSIAAIAEWAAEAPQPVRAALGTRHDPRTGRWVWAVPTETTIRRTLARVDPEALAAAIGAWLADRDQPDQRRRAVAVDGKTLRGARRAADGRQVHLLAAMDHATRAVLAQRQVDGALARFPASSRCWPASTLPARWSPPTRCKPTLMPPNSW
jgi:DDE_Tnp_1-associated